MVAKVNLTFDCRECTPQGRQVLLNILNEEGYRPNRPWPPHIDGVDWPWLIAWTGLGLVPHTRDPVYAFPIIDASFCNNLEVPRE